jgi:hypothetical protein
VFCDRHGVILANGVILSATKDPPCLVILSAAKDLLVPFLSFSPLRRANGGAHITERLDRMTAG